MDVEFGASKRLPAPDDRWLEVTPSDSRANRSACRCGCSRGQVGHDLNIVAAPGTPAIVGGPRHGTGVLIIIIWADPIAAPAAK